MGAFNRPGSFRRRGAPNRSEDAPPAHRPAVSWGVLAAIGLLLAGMPILFFNQQHSGDRLKIRRELRKF